MFKHLSQLEIIEYRQWARNHYNPRKDTINPVWHPVVQDECRNMQLEVQAADLEHTQWLEEYDRTTLKGLING